MTILLAMIGLPPAIEIEMKYVSGYLHMSTVEKHEAVKPAPVNIKDTSASTNTSATTATTSTAAAPKKR